MFDLLGRRIAMLFDGVISPGTAHTLVFERKGLAAGPYVVRVQGEAFVESRRITLLP